MKTTLVPVLALGCAFAASASAALAQPTTAPTALPTATPVAATPMPLPSIAATPAAGPVPAGSARIVNTGSTNFAGYVITIAKNGAVTYSNGGPASQATLAAPQTRWLFLKLAADAPFSGMTTRRCMKSASFGSSTFIEFDGARTPDLSCGGDAAITELGRTVNVIVGALGIHSTAPRRRVNPAEM